MGENAGVVDVGEGLAVTFKVESHNHPSYVEPYQGAATGVGGIVRDILTMGARPVLVMDPLRFGDADHPDTARVLPGIVAGVGGYGNCLGLPNIGGEVVFDPTYQGNPLVNALCLGVMPNDRIQLSAARGVGNVVVLLGAKTGRDGIGGVSVLASATFDEDGPARRPSVQVGDPFTEKLLIEACLEMYDAELVEGIQDLGGAGLTCALTETAAAGRSGMRAHLDRVPLREASMEPHEVLASESQERMLAIVTPDEPAAVLAIADKWGVLATAIGEVVEGDRLEVLWHGEAVVDVPPGSLADDGPVYERPMARPADLDDLRAAAPPAHPGVDELPTCCCAWSPRPTCAAAAGSSSSTTASCSATPCWPGPRTPASCACRRRPGSASRSRPTATAATPGSTRTPARSSRSPRPTATSPPPAPSRSP